MEVYGYARVSTREQKEDRQMIALTEHSVDEKNIFVDKQSGKDLVGTFVSDIVLQVLSFVAENERTNIRQRQAEGIAAAKAKGVRFGRPPRSLPHNFCEICQKWQAKEISVSEAAQKCNMPRSTFFYRAQAYINREG